METQIQNVLNDMAETEEVLKQLRHLSKTNNKIGMLGLLQVSAKARYFVGRSI